MQPSNILITGRPGTGKTTLVQNLCLRLAGFRQSGFYTSEIRRHGTRQGFELVSLDGRRLILAHVDFSANPRVGRYGVDVAGFDGFLDGLRLDDPETVLTVIDEIGRMECLSYKFTEMVRKVLDFPGPLLATVAAGGRGLMEEVRQRPDIEMMEVTFQNRNQLLPVLEKQVRVMLSKRTDTGD